MPFGELFDMERAAEYCAKKNRWSFFVTSEVCPILFPKSTVHSDITEGLQTCLEPVQVPRIFWQFSETTCESMATFMFSTLWQNSEFCL